MTIFKTTLRIVRAHAVAFLIYLFLPVLMTLLFVGAGSRETDVYKTTAIRFAVIDHDRSDLSQGLVSYLEKDNIKSTMATDRDSIRDALFYMQLDYVLEIPEHFERDLLHSTPVTLGRQIAPDTMAPSALDTRINRFIRFAESHRAIDPAAPPAVLAERATASASYTGDVVFESYGQETGLSTLPSLFRFLAYTLLNLSLLIVSQTLLSFRQKPVLERSLVAAMSPSTINRKLIGSVLVVCTIAFLLNILPSFLSAGRHVFTRQGLLLLFNATCFALVAIALGFLAAGVSNRDGGVSDALRTVVPLVMSFFTGIFVPLEYIPQTIQKVGSFMPTYWYNMSIIEMENRVHVTSELTGIFLRNGLIQLAFAAVFFVVYLAVDYYRQQQRIPVPVVPA